jgi:hypothetical protein
MPAESRLQARLPAPQVSEQPQPTAGYSAGGDRRNRLSHQEIVAAHEEIKIV